MYYTYMIRCKDNSIYTGITTDLERRTKEHIEKQKQCAKYTYFHTAIKLEIAWESNTRIEATKLEYWIKQLSKEKKENLIRNNKLLKDYLSDKIDINSYKIPKLYVKK